MPPTSSRFRCSSRAIRRKSDVQGVVMRRERPGGRPAGDRVQRRPFDLDKALAGQRVADRLHDLRPPQEPLAARLRCGSGRDSASAAAVRDRSALVLFRRRLERLGEEVELLGEDRQFAGPACASARRRRRSGRPGRSIRPGPSSPRRPGSCRSSPGSGRSSRGCRGRSACPSSAAARSGPPPGPSGRAAPARARSLGRGGAAGAGSTTISPSRRRIEPID